MESLPISGRGLTGSINSWMGASTRPRRHFPESPFDRHRGGGHPPTPATPPCVRVRTRRFELVALTPIDQRRKAERFEVGIGKPHRKGFGPSEVPGAASGGLSDPLVATNDSVSSHATPRAAPVSAEEKSSSIWMFCCLSSVRLMAYLPLLLVRAFSVAGYYARC